MPHIEKNSIASESTNENAEIVTSTAIRLVCGLYVLSNRWLKSILSASHRHLTNDWMAHTDHTMNAPALANAVRRLHLVENRFVIIAPASVISIVSPIRCQFFQMKTTFFLKHVPACVGLGLSQNPCLFFLFCC